MKRLGIALLLSLCLFAQKTPKPPKNGLYAVFNTEFGNIRVSLFEKDTPNSVAAFVGLAQGTLSWKDPNGAMVKKPMYDNTTFYRILAGDVVQGGSPTGDSSYNCGFTIKDEILPGIRFGGGSLAIANAGTPDTGGCQFFFTTGPMHAFDQKYAIIGQVTEGEDVVMKMSRVPVHGDKPVTPPKLISVTIERVGPVPEVKKKK
jgi:cyclophilin family peptidyl-prolyl cis-trans isomerase